jgi:hypothetical protein
VTRLAGQLSGFSAAGSILDGDPIAVPTEADLAKEVAAPGEAALVPYGITYQAHWERPGDGMARHARAQARALASAGVVVGLRGMAQHRMQLEDDIDDGSRREVGYLRSVSFSEAVLAIRQLVIQNAQHLMAVVCPFGARDAGPDAIDRVCRSTVVYTSWERSTVPEDVVTILNRTAQVWVPCQANADAFKAAGVLDVRVIPCPYDPGAHLTSDIPRPRGPGKMPHGKRFYAIGKWEPRKNHALLIGAFLRAFTPKKAASLYIKTSPYGFWENYPSPTDTIAAWLTDAEVRAQGWTPENVASRVRVSTKQMTERELARVHEQNNIYVSVSAGEAWDLPAFDAVVAGNALVHTGYGGSSEYGAYARAQYSVAWELGPVDPSYGWEPEARWAAVHVEDVKEMLREVATPAPDRVAPQGLSEKFGMHAVGWTMRCALATVLCRNTSSRQLYDEKKLRSALGMGFGDPARPARYSQETKEAHGQVILACLRGTPEQRDQALSHLAKMVHCDLTGELRGPHT